jgi:hypothetical protein
MHPNENPAMILVTPLLNGGNYHSWSQPMTVALRSKNKIPKYALFITSKRCKAIENILQSMGIPWRLLVFSIFGSVFEISVSNFIVSI